ncbi:MAG: hypothetical protein ACRCUY_07090 [Thermoguttaceae bacterium]
MRLAFLSFFLLSFFVTESVFVTDSVFGDDFDVRPIFRSTSETEKVLTPDGTHPFGDGFTTVEEDGTTIYICDNGDSAGTRGVRQVFQLNQTAAIPIIVSGWSRAENVSGSPDTNYALYCDIAFNDDTFEWGRAIAFPVGTTNWNQREMTIFPEKPIKSLSFYSIFRGNHSGKALFKDMQVKVQQIDGNIAFFDGVPVPVSDSDTKKTPKKNGDTTLWIREVGADGDFLNSDKPIPGIRVEKKEINRNIVEYTLTSTDDADHILTVTYSVTTFAPNLRYCKDPRITVPVEENKEYTHTSSNNVGAVGRLAKYPFAAVASGTKGKAVGIDINHPFYFRTGYNASMQELFVTGDVALVPENRTVTLRFCRFDFDGKHDFRGALAAYYELFPKAFESKIKKHGIWMAFEKISQVENWEDFGFMFKEGDNEPEWDFSNGIMTFRYLDEPMTCWMSIPADVPHTMSNAIAVARKLADEGNRKVLSLFNAGFRDENGEFVGIFQDTPWTNGIVWSMNDTPKIPSTPENPNSFEIKWNKSAFENSYGPNRKVELAGEYVDSSEGYVTAEIDYCRDHFSGSRYPLVYSTLTKKPGVFRGLIGLEYIETMAADIHGAGKYMMANATPHAICWFMPLLDVAGTETNWNYGGTWRPLSDAEMLFTRSLCAKKPYCYIMNTHFDDFTKEMTEKYMRRSLAYGMYPGFFSEDASSGHYFTRPELYNRDRDLFKKYIPLCKKVGEAGWQPITFATTNDPDIFVERFSDAKNEYYTIFNSSLNDSKKAAIRFIEGSEMFGSNHTLFDFVHEQSFVVNNNEISIELGPEDVMVLQRQK